MVVVDRRGELEGVGHVGKELVSSDAQASLAPGPQTAGVDVDEKLFELGALETEPLAVAPAPEQELAVVRHGESDPPRVWAAAASAVMISDMPALAPRALSTQAV